MGEPRPGERAVSSVIAVVLLVAVTVTLASTVLVLSQGFSDRTAAPSFAAVDAETVTVTDSANIDTNECPNLSGHRELGARVTMTQFGGADRIYVRVSSEGATDRQVLWTDPSPETVGESLVLANEVTASPEVDIDIGGGGDTAFCPGEEAVIEIYAERDDRVQLVQELTVE